MDKNRLRRELGWLAGGFVLPLVALLALDLLTTSSPLPFWRRLLTLEDTCAYGLCVLIPAVVYLVVLLLRWTLGKKPG